MIAGRETAALSMVRNSGILQSRRGPALSNHTSSADTRVRKRVTRHENKTKRSYGYDDDGPKKFSHSPAFRRNDLEEINRSKYRKQY